MNPIKIYCVKWNKFRKFVYPKISYILDKTLKLSIIFSKCIDNNDRTFKEEKKVLR